MAVLVILTRISTKPVFTAVNVPETVSLRPIGAYRIDVTQADPSQVIANARVYESGLYLLAKGRDQHARSVLLRTDFTGRTSLTIPLPEAGATSFRVLPSGNLVLYQYQRLAGGTFREYNGQGIEIGSTAEQRPVRAFLFSGNHLVRFFPGFSWDRVMLPLSSAMEVSSAGTGVAVTPEVIVEAEQAQGRSGVWLIDRTTGRLSRLDVTSGVRTEFTVHSPDLDQSVAAYEALRKGAPKGSVPGAGHAVLSGAIDADDSLYLALSPYKIRDHAVILQVDRFGIVQRRLLCSLASEGDSAVRIDPTYIGIAAKHLYLVSYSGQIGVFSL